MTINPNEKPRIAGSWNPGTILGNRSSGRHDRSYAIDFFRLFFRIVEFCFRIVSGPAGNARQPKISPKCGGMDLRQAA
jgi:hypothetical protein